MSRPKKQSKCKWCSKNKKMRMLWETNECFDCYVLNYVDSLQCKIRHVWQRSFPNAYEWQIRKDEKIMAHIEKVDSRHMRPLSREEFLEIYPDIKPTGDKNESISS